MVVAIKQYIALVWWYQCIIIVLLLGGIDPAICIGHIVILGDTTISDNFV